MQNKVVVVYHNPRTASNNRPILLGTVIKMYYRVVAAIN